MSKIAILTLMYKNYNYGGVLQAYALQKKLQIMGYDSEQIKYEKELTYNKAKKSINLINRVCVFLVRFILKEKLFLRKRKFDLFIDRNIKSSLPFTKSQLVKENTNYNAFVVGSDQVWNPNWIDSTYFLDFVKPSVKKISYAASIGVSSIPDEKQQFYYNNLKSFDALSVREIYGQKELSQILDKPVYKVADPTLLLSGDQWKNISKDIELNEDYIFCYFLGANRKTHKIVSEVSKRLGLKIVSLPYLTGLSNAGFFFGDIRLYSVGPDEFLGLIKNAKYIITDSFHGCVFSIIFNKQFCVIERGYTENMNNQNSRIYDLLYMFGLESRLFNVGNSNAVIDILESNYKTDDVNQKINTIEKKSSEFIKKALEN